MEENVVHNLAHILTVVLRTYPLPQSGDHGVAHWARVLQNGLRVAESNGADREVVTLFALFHDSRRVNEGDDDGHGLRGGEFARSLRGSLVHLDDTRFALLYEACRLHTDGLTDGDPTLLACWDADRLDLGRAGITPRRDLLCTDAACGLLDWAHARAVTGYAPRAVLNEWGYRQDEFGKTGFAPDTRELLGSTASMRTSFTTEYKRLTPTLTN